MVLLDPLWEEAHYEVMRLYAALGQPTACLRQYQELERILHEELEETPSAQARALAEEMRDSARTFVVARRSFPPAEGAREREGEAATDLDGTLHAHPPGDSGSPSVVPPSPHPLAPSGF